MNGFNSSAHINGYVLNDKNSTNGNGTMHHNSHSLPHPYIDDEDDDSMDRHASSSNNHIHNSNYSSFHNGHRSPNSTNSKQSISNGLIITHNDTNPVTTNSNSVNMNVSSGGSAMSNSGNDAVNSNGSNGNSSNGNNGNNSNGNANNNQNNDNNNEQSNSDEVPSVSSQPKRVFSSGQKDILRLIGQHLRYLGLNKTTETLVSESDCVLEHPIAANFCNLIMNGNWNEVIIRLKQQQNQYFFTNKFAFLGGKIIK
jgi:hypothetical protein